MTAKRDVYEEFLRTAIVISAVRFPFTSARYIEIVSFRSRLAKTISAPSKWVCFNPRHVTFEVLLPLLARGMDVLHQIACLIYRGVKNKKMSIGEFCNP